jgi:hypothetical protein
MADKHRTQVWIDQFQTKLTLRIGAYLVIFLAVLFNSLFAWRLWVEGPGHLGEQCVRMVLDYMPVWICLLILVPVMAWDAVRFSHRLVGPLGRFRRTLHDVAKGEPVGLIKLREGDYLTDLRDEVNEMLEALQRRGLPVLKPNDPMTDDNSHRNSA